MSEPSRAEAGRVLGKKYACLTVDLDSLDCYREIHGLSRQTSSGGESQADLAYSVGVRRLLNFFAEHDTPSTLFVVGRDAGHGAHADLLGEAAQAGHELGNHTFSHFYDLPGRHQPVQRDEIAAAEDAIERVCGHKPVGYRAPGYNISPDILKILKDRGYLYDSSVFSCPPYYLAKAAIMGWQRLRGRPSRSAMVAAENLLAPLTPYRPAARRIWRCDAGSEMPIEVPMCLVPGVRFPVIGTSLHILGKTGFNAAFGLLKATHNRIFQLEFHAVDFMDAHDLARAPDAAELIAAQPDLRIPWAKKRATYTHVIDRLKRENYVFATLKTAVKARAGAGAGARTARPPSIS